MSPAQHMATLIYLDEFRAPADFATIPMPPAVGAGMPDRRVTLADCWYRSQLRADLIEVGAGLLIGSVALAVVLWVLSVAGVLPV
jgi:hypothetical protein